METVLVTLIVMALVLFAIPTLANSALTAQNSSVQDWQHLQEVSIERAATSLEIGDVQAQNNTIDLTIENKGNTKLYDFDEWDVIVQYYAAPQRYKIEWVPYVTSEYVMHWWRVMGIYLDADQGVGEVFEPGLLNPREQVVIRVTVTPPVESGAAAQVTICTPNGITASAVFVCQ
jgi:hypothetical protein